MKQKPSIIVQIVHINGPLKGKIQEFTGDQVAIGRHPSCEVVFPKDQTLISRRHANIQRVGNTFILLDESANGTFVNGKRISKVQLKSGDVITIGEGGPKVSFLSQVGTALAVPEQSRVPEPSTSESDLKYNTAADLIPGDSPGRLEKRPQSDQTPAPSVSYWEPVPTQRVEKPAPKAEVPHEIHVVSAQQPLVIQYGPRLETYKTLPVTLGRGRDCDFCFDHEELVEHHAQIFFYQDRYWIKDLSGRNLISIDGKPIQLQAPLTAHCKISLGPRGPHFDFLGEGRLAEVTAPVTPPGQAEDSPRPKHPKSQEEKPGKFSNFMHRLRHKE